MDTLPPPILPDDAIDADLQMRLGRNLLVFQRIEVNLKRLMSSNRLELHIPLGTAIKDVDPDTLLSKVKRRAKERQEQTLGPLRNAYLAEILGIEATADHLVSDGFGFRLDARVDLQDSEKTEVSGRLNELIKDRNEMMHNLLPRLGKGEPENIDSAKQWLDEVYQRANEFLMTLRLQMHGLAEARNSLIEFMQSGGFKLPE